jgi:SAM-dependent methyltransferase
MTDHPMDVNTNTRVRWEVIRHFPEFESLAGKSVLDLGSGLGFFSLRFKELGALVHAVDVDRNALSHIEQNYGVKSTYADIETDPLPVGPFDYIFIGEVLEHLNDPADLFRRAAGSLAEGGFLLVTVPALEGPLIHSKGKMLGHEHGSEKHERDGFQLNELRLLIEEAGLSIIRHEMTIYWLAELFMQLTKRGFLKNKKSYGSQSDVIDMMKSPSYRLLKAVYPILMMFFTIEQGISRFFGLKGHCHVIMGAQRSAVVE